MNKNQWFYRVALWTIALVVIISLLAVSLPQTAQAANNNLPTNATYSASGRKGKITINTAGFREQTKFKVRVKDAAQSQPKFYNLGSFIAEKKTSQTNTFVLPKALRSALWVDVCLKDQHNDKLYCQKVFNPNG